MPRKPQGGYPLLLVFYALIHSVFLLSSSAVMAIAVGTLADIYEPCERGTKMGIYYSAPLLGVSIGPFVGGVLAQAFGWRAIYWSMLIAGGIVLVSLFIFFRDTFRKERSLVYQDVLHRSSEQRQLSTVSPSRSDTVESSTDKSQQTSTKKTTEGLEAGMPANSSRTKDITLSFMDVNPFPPVLVVLKRRNNNAILLASGRFIAWRS